MFIVFISSPASIGTLSVSATHQESSGESFSSTQCPSTPPHVVFLRSGSLRSRLPLHRTLFPDGLRQLWSSSTHYLCTTSSAKQAETSTATSSSLNPLQLLLTVCRDLYNWISAVGSSVLCDFGNTAHCSWIICPKTAHCFPQCISPTSEL